MIFQALLSTMASTKLIVICMATIFLLHYDNVSSFEYQAGGNLGWVVPPANDTKIYNDWASENRFKVGDAVHFKYKKDSVMEVTQDDYKKCNSSRPNYFSNIGNSLYKLNHSGDFYFISGVSGHCDKGQRMIIKVMSSEEEDQDSGGGRDKSGAAILDKSSSKLVFLVCCFAAYYIF